MPARNPAVIGFAALWLLVTALLTVSLHTAPPLRVDVGAPNDDRFLWGFWLPEQGGGLAFRWSGDRARLLAHGAPFEPTLLRLQLNGDAPARAGATRFELIGQAASLATFDVAPGWRSYQVLVPAGATADRFGVARPIELRSALNRYGADTDQLDLRDLGVPLAEWRLERLAGASPAATLPRALGLAWLVLVLALPAPLLLPRRGLPIALGLLGLGGAALLAWSRLDPQGLAWALPFTPWALGSASLALALVGVRGWLLERQGRPDLRQSLVGLGALIVGAGLLQAQLLIAPAGALALAGTLLIAGGARGLGAAAWEPALPPVGRRTAWLCLGAIFALALGLRLYQIDLTPFGLWRDEARHGLFALQVLGDPNYRPAYVIENSVDLPALGLYPFALAIHLGGVNLWSMRVATALAGALTVLPLYALATMLSGRRLLGLGAALLLAVSSWHITISRIAFPTVFDPLLTLSGLWLVCVALHPAGRGPQRLLAGALAGICLGLAAQTYHTGRLAPLYAAGLALLLIPRGRVDRLRWAGTLLLAGAVALAVSAPLIDYALSRSADFNDRVGRVFLLDEQSRGGQAALATLDESLGRHLLMFHAFGDANGRHHAPSRPLLDLLAGLGVLAGLAALLRRWRDWRSLFVLGALALGVLPSLLAVEGPHGMRAIGALSPALIIAAVGWLELGRVLVEVLRVAQARQLLLGGAAATSLLALGLNAGLYFGAMPRDPEVFVSFYPVQSQIGTYIRAAHEAGEDTAQLYVPEILRNDPVFAYLTYGLQVRYFNDDGLVDLPLAGARMIVSGYFIERETAALSDYIGAAPLPLTSGPDFPDGRGPVFLVFETR